MEYRGLYISKCYDEGIERPDANGEYVPHPGYFCQVYADEDLDYEIDNFCLAVGHEIPDDEDDTVEQAIKEYVDDSYEMYREAQKRLLADDIDSIPKFV